MVQWKILSLSLCLLTIFIHFSQFFSLVAFGVCYDLFHCTYFLFSWAKEVQKIFPYLFLQTNINPWPYFFSQFSICLPRNLHSSKNNNNQQQKPTTTNNSFWKTSKSMKAYKKNTNWSKKRINFWMSKFHWPKSKYANSKKYCKW